MSNPTLIYLGPACQENGDGREWCQDDMWERCECGHESVRYVIGAEHDRVTAQRDGLQLSLNTADQTIDDLNAAVSRRTQRVRELEAQLDQAVTALNEVVKVSAMYEKPFEIATLAIGELSVSAEPIKPFTEQFLEDHLGKKPLDPKIIGIERMPPMEYDEP